MTVRRQVRSLCNLFAPWAFVVLLLCAASGFAQEVGSGTSSPGSEASSRILPYIHNGWRTLTRSTNECASLSDPKLNRPGRVLYLPHGMAAPPEVAAMREKCDVRVDWLPREITGIGQVTPAELSEQGLLYLPNPYVVPGGRFNEMYGWDSYFILRGLIADGEVELARGMVENFFFEIEHYGALLNANRTYYLTRSQPPFLSSMILAVHQAELAAHRDDRGWLERAYGFAQRDYQLWMSPPKLDPATGLSRYFDSGHGPVQEIGDHSDYYLTVADWLVKHPGRADEYLTTDQTRGAGPALRVPLCAGKPCSDSREHWLTPDFYQGDRAMRESGFDISFRFGPFNGSAQHFAPVCLNSLLFKEENDLAEMASSLGRQRESVAWRRRAEQRRSRVNRYLWDSRRGLFVDYNLQSHSRSGVLYASTFYPLWTGLASPEQAKAVLRHLPEFEQPGGIVMSDVESGVQWDKPYGWAPIQLIADDGMRRYGFNADADRISSKFLTMVVENAKKDGVIVEKYNVMTRSSQTHVTAGYANVIGFGWTNGTFLVLLHELPMEAQQQVLSAAPTTASASAGGR